MINAMVGELVGDVSVLKERVRVLEELVRNLLEDREDRGVMEEVQP